MSTTFAAEAVVDSSRRKTRKPRRRPSSRKSLRRVVRELAGKSNMPDAAPARLRPDAEVELQELPPSPEPCCWCRGSGKEPSLPDDVNVSPAELARESGVDLSSVAKIFDRKRKDHKNPRLDTLRKFQGAIYRLKGVELPLEKIAQAFVRG